LLPISGWEGIWILNPDAEPEPGALRALVECAVAGNKGMVGSTIVPPLTATTFIAVPAIAGVSYGPTLPLSALGSQSMDRSISRRSRRLSIALPVDRCMSREHVSRQSVRWMNDFFCFTTTPTGPSAQSRMVWDMRVTLLCRTGEAQRSDRSDSALKDPRLSVYLENRNHLHFVRVHWHRYLFVAILLGCVDAITYLFALSPIFKAAVDGLLA
jgi:N-acetylglucosaminyl-diphospho-decaprenol L-rhamnosyltransferase